MNIFSRRQINSIRIDRVKLRHQDIPYKAIWRDGKLNLADYLSRHRRKLEKFPKYIQQETEELSKLCWFIHGSPYMEVITVRKDMTARVK